MPDDLDAPAILSLLKRRDNTLNESVRAHSGVRLSGWRSVLQGSSGNTSTQFHYGAPDDIRPSIIKRTYTISNYGIIIFAMVAIVTTVISSLTPPIEEKHTSFSFFVFHDISKQT
ncbi:hypothetical protein CHS0354_025423 [Potamilus streckersoni]|uniref:Uncharacterized protein n=1 Tax=Potamilus streckersoni TaxID=2493646 RepID=A0AAE0W0B4_9BIVA|nr:hypothetical protein CHS0354_025423 [Potamilus streckersoni]